LNQIPYDPELLWRAQRGNVCLRVSLTKSLRDHDEATLAIAAAIVPNWRRWRALSLLVLETLPSVAHQLPQSILDDLEKSQVSIFAVQAQKTVEVAHAMTEV